MNNHQGSEARLQAVGLSECGPSRASNQDAIYYDVSQVGPVAEQIGLFIICDGMGGHQAGDRASRAAINLIVSTLRSDLARAQLADAPLEAATIHELIMAAIKDANSHIHQMAEDPVDTNRKMGTTVALALVYDGVAHMANVGDSRIYLLRRNRMTQITDDHSFAAELAHHGHIAPEEIVGHPHSNVLSRALGVASAVEVDKYETPLVPGDRLLLCSDGLWKSFPNHADLARLLAAEDALENLIQQSVSEALRRDGSDNVSAILVSVGPKPAHRKLVKHSANGSISRHHSNRDSVALQPHLSTLD